MKANMNINNLGVYIKTEIIPKGMSVTETAKLLGIGRPALSNMLNGKSSLSKNMSKRLEKTFGCSSKELLTLQDSYNEVNATDNKVPIVTKNYVPAFLKFKANDIEQWSTTNIPARTRLPVFLRTLVNSTGSGLSKVDFPGNDDGERPGWDGFIESSEETPWIPKGKSGWEFGVTIDIKGKAEGDFKKSVDALTKQERSDITFVFVTTRRWKQKDNWAKSKKIRNMWKDVRVLDSSDIEQWMEQSLSAQAWFANETFVSAKGVRSLDKCWNDWENVSEPSISKKIFSSAINASRSTLLSILSKPAEGPIIISADSKEEALAFTSELLSESGGLELATYRDQTLVFDEPGTLTKLAESTQKFIPVIHNGSIESELAPYYCKLHSIVVYPRNALNVEPHIVLEPASHEAFDDAMKDMGKNRDDAQRLANESGRSPTVLRRRLSKSPAIQSPEWACDHQTKIGLIPFLLVGAWNSNNEDDKCGLELISGDKSYSTLEREFQRLLQLNDSPVWMVDCYQGVVSKLDLLFAISSVLTKEDLNRYFQIARMVLGEDDPALDLDEDLRWAASIYGKTREFSTAFREGLAETLVLLSVHGDTLFKGRYSSRDEVNKLIRDLLSSPLTIRALEANNQDLPVYAEAAPYEFLSILESDLKRDEPAVIELLRPVNVAVFSQPARTGLLWALEGLSWNPLTLPQATNILAQLAQIEIKDNWTNKPINSLLCIFSSWMPQTAADLCLRMGLIKKIMQKYPDVGWEICITQLDSQNTIGHYSHKPKWRTDGYGFGEPLENPSEIHDFTNEMILLAMTREVYSISMLIELIEILDSLNDDNQQRIWSIIKEWSENTASDEEKSLLREKIRVTLFSRRRFKQSSKAKTNSILAYDSLEPKDLLNKHAWLFQESWLEPSAEEGEDIDKLDFDERNKKIALLRVSALKEIFDKKGIKGLLKLASLGNTDREIGWICSNSVLNKTELIELLTCTFNKVLDNGNKNNSQKNLIYGALDSIKDKKTQESIIFEVAKDKSEIEFVSLLLMAPFRKSTWEILNKISCTAQDIYWKQVSPTCIHENEEENIKAVYMLLKANRHLAAFNCIKYNPEKIKVKTLCQLLLDMPTEKSEDTDKYRPDDYHVKKAFELINASLEISLDEKAQLEFTYMEGLSSRSSGNEEKNSIPNLERYVRTNPSFFVQLLTWTYKRRDGLVEENADQKSSEQVRISAKRGRTLLKILKTIPGSNDQGELNIGRMKKWIATVRNACCEQSRLEVCDLSIGKLLSYSLVGNDGFWPCEEVREVLEDIQSEDIISGMCMGVYNSRGVTTRMPSEGGDQERNLVEKYRELGDNLLHSNPYVATKLLFRIAYNYELEARRNDSSTSIRERLE